MNKKDLVKLLIGLVVVAGICGGAYYLGKMQDRQNKYRHPITQPGARW